MIAVHCFFLSVFISVLLSHFHTHTLVKCRTSFHSRFSLACSISRLLLLSGMFTQQNPSLVEHLLAALHFNIYPDFLIYSPASNLVWFKGAQYNTSIDSHRGQQPSPLFSSKPRYKHRYPSKRWDCVQLLCFLEDKWWIHFQSFQMLQRKLQTAQSFYGQSFNVILA